MHRWARATLFAVATAAFACSGGCDRQPPAPAPEAGAAAGEHASTGTVPDGQASSSTPARHLPVVIATNLPLAVFVQLIAGDLVRVEQPTPAGEDPADWRPSAEAIAQMQHADLVIAHGAGYEQWMATASLPRSRTLEVSTALQGKLIELSESVTHSHGPAGAHTHHGTATGTWLDFDLAAQEAQAVAARLQQLLPSGAPAMRANGEALVARLHALAARSEAAGRAFGGAPLLASHPVYDYLARRAGLNLRSVHWEPGDPQSAEDWKAFDALHAGHRAKVMLWEGEPAPETRQQLLQRGIRVVVFPPGPNGATDQRAPSAWFAQMESNLAALEAAAAQP